MFVIVTTSFTATDPDISQSPMHDATVTAASAISTWLTLSPALHGGCPVTGTQV